MPIYQTEPIAANLADIQPQELAAFSRTLDALVAHWPGLRRNVSLIQVVGRRLRFTLDVPLDAAHAAHLGVTEV